MAEISNVLSISRALRLFQRKRIPANCLVSDAVGDCVYITGPKIGQRYQVAKALPSTPVTMPAIGVIVAKTSPTICQVQVLGEVINIYSGFTPGDLLFVGALGTPSHVPGPVPQAIGIAVDSDVLYLNPELDGGISNYRNNQGLMATGDPRLWKTSEFFLHRPGSVSIEVFHNGRALVQASSATANDGEYFVAETVFGAGFNEVHVTTFTPNAQSRFRASYFVA